MGIENMRRWPMYIVFAVCILLVLSLLNSWSYETDLRTRVAEISIQLQECSKQQANCMEESLTLTEQRDRYLDKVNTLNKQKTKLDIEVADAKNKLSLALVSTGARKLNKTLVEVDLCKTELESLKSLHVSKTAIIETLRLEKNTLVSRLEEKSTKIDDLQKEIDRLKNSLTSKSAVPVPAAPSKITPAAIPPKLSSALNANNPINEPVLENNAKEELEDTNDINSINEPNDVDPQLQ